MVSYLDDDCDNNNNNNDDGVAYSGCKIYNHLPLHIKNISNNVPLFKSILKKLLLQYVFYSVDEYYQQNFNDCVY